jgi:hypothetical protein
MNFSELNLKNGSFDRLSPLLSSSNPSSPFSISSEVDEYHGLAYGFHNPSAVDEDLVKRRKLLQASSESADDWSTLLYKKFPFLDTQYYGESQRSNLELKELQKESQKLLICTQPEVKSGSKQENDFYFDLLAPKPFYRTPLETKYPGLLQQTRVIPATQCLRLFRLPKSPETFRVFDPKVDGRNFKDGVVYSCEQKLPKIGQNQQKPFLNMLFHPLLQFLCVDLSRRSNGTSSISPDYVFNSVSSAQGGILVRLTDALFPYSDPVHKSSKMIGNLLQHFHEPLIPRPSSSLICSSTSAFSIPVRSRGRTRISDEKQIIKKRLRLSSSTSLSTRKYDESFDEQQVRIDQAIAAQFKEKSLEFCKELHGKNNDFLTVDGLMYHQETETENESKGKRIATSVVGLCMYEINQGPSSILSSYCTSASTSTTCTKGSVTSSGPNDSLSLKLKAYMHVTLILGDPLAKSSGVLAFVLCLRLARRLGIAVILEAVDRRQLKAGLRDDLIGMYKSKFGFSEMIPAEVKEFCSKPEKGVVFMILHHDFLEKSFSPLKDEMIAYENYLISLISSRELETIENESLKQLPRISNFDQLMTHNEDDGSPSICKSQVGRLTVPNPVLSTSNTDSEMIAIQQSQMYPSASEFFRKCNTFSKSAPVPKVLQSEPKISVKTLSTLSSTLRERSISVSSNSSLPLAALLNTGNLSGSEILNLDKSEKSYAEKLQSIQLERRLADALAIAEKERLANDFIQLEREKDRQLLQSRMQEIEDLQNLEAQRRKEIEKLNKEMIDNKKELEAQKLEILSLQTKYENEKYEKEKQIQDLKDQSIQESKENSDQVCGKKRARDSKLFDSFLQVQVADVQDVQVANVQDLMSSASGSTSASTSSSISVIYKPDDPQKMKKTCVSLFTGKYSSLYLRSLHPGLTNPVQVNGSTIEVTQSWSGEIIRKTFNSRSLYIHNVTPLDVAHKQTLRGTIKQMDSDFVLEAKSSMSQTFQKSRFRFIFDTQGKFLRGYEYGLMQNEEIGWIEQNSI